jgi:hypothetical protein
MEKGKEIIGASHEPPRWNEIVEERVRVKVKGSWREYQKYVHIYMY